MSPKPYHQTKWNIDRMSHRSQMVLIVWWENRLNTVLRVFQPIHGRPPHIVGCYCYQTLPGRGFFGQGQESAAFVGAQPGYGPGRVGSFWAGVQYSAHTHTHIYIYIYVCLPSLACMPPIKLGARVCARKKGEPTWGWISHMTHRHVGLFQAPTLWRSSDRMLAGQLRQYHNRIGRRDW